MNLFTKGGLTAIFCALSVFRATADTVPLASLSDPSIAPVSSTGSGDSGVPIISADGRYVLFASTANNLVVSNNVAAPPLLAFFNVYLRDRTNGTTTLVSVNYSGNGGGNGDSVPRGISTNGQFVLFESTARNLTTNNNSTNAVTFPGDVYVRDVVNGVTTLVSVNTSGVGPNSALSSVMSADGHLVAFASTSTTLVAGDANSIKDVFVRDLQAGTTSVVSVGALGNASLTNFSESPAMTPDGRYVVFYSTATNLVPGVQTMGEIYERDLQAGTTTWVSKDARNLFFANVGTSNEVACNFKVSDDGNFIAYEACTNPVANSTSNLARGIILRFNVSSNTTDVIETNANVPITAFESIHTLDMTPDGRFVAYVNNVGGLGQATLGVSVWDAQSATSTLVSVNTNGVASTGAFCDSPAISTNGQFVSFVSSATDLVTNTVPSGYHAYLRDTLAGSTTRLVDVDLNGAGAGVNYGAIPVLSADGSNVVYESSNGNVVSNDLNLRFDVFLMNTASNRTELVSARDATLPSVTPRGPSGQSTYSVSTTGRYVAFASESDDLTLNDTNEWRDVFVRDMLTGSNTLVSVATNGFSGAGLSLEPAISGTGRYVAFSSYATNLVAGDTNLLQEVFIRDLQSNTTAMVSVAMDGVTPGNSNCFQPSISADGRFVLFHSQASNLAPGSFGNGVENLFLRDLQLGTTYALTAAITGTGSWIAAMTPDGQYVGFSSSSFTGSNTFGIWNTQLTAVTYTNPTLGILIAISPNGQRLAYSAGSLKAIDVVLGTNWVVSTGASTVSPSVHFTADSQSMAYATTAANASADVNGISDVYLYSFQSSSNILISSRLNPSLPNDSPADSPALSADGRFVVYRSASTNIVAGTGNLVPNLYVFDRGTGTNMLLTQSRFGGGASAGQSRTPVFSGDGRTVVFQSWAPDLATGDFNTAGDMYAYSFFYLNETLASSSPAMIVLNWPVIPGQTYQAQYKNNLTDVGWQDLGGVVGIMGNQAFLTNPYVPLNPQQFYRVTAH